MLDAIGDGIELLALSRRYQSVFVSEGLAGVRRVRDAVEKKRLRLNASYLRGQKLIQESRRGAQLLLTLTDEGRRQLLRAELLRAPKRRDNLFTIVIFDIPESERTSREFFRRFIREIGFQKIQQSVWATDRDVGRALIQFVRIHKLAAWINILEGKSLMTDK